MRKCADRFDVPIAGGDVTSWKQDLLVTCVTALGRDAHAQPVLRSGARPGDVILVTGELGGSLLGRHVRFIPRVDESLALVRRIRPHAMIDVSDGLSSDLGHIAQESGVGAVIDEQALPVSRDARRAAKVDGRSATEHALDDGEDFELIVTMSGRDAQRVLARPPFRTRLTAIGRIVRKPGLFIRTRDGKERRLEPGGYEHLPRD
jgi:thiamine-monophosphate kinase